MKKRFLLMSIVALVMLQLCSCRTFRLEGMDNYDPLNSNVETTVKLLPYEDFHKTHAYVDANYIYYDVRTAQESYDTDFMYLVYEPQVYEVAKADAIANMVLSEDNRYEWNGYVFIENNSFFRDKFPEWWNMFAYNDEKNELVFLGFYLGRMRIEKDMELLTFSDIGAFMEKYFPFYDFSPAQVTEAE